MTFVSNIDETLPEDIVKCLVYVLNHLGNPTCSGNLWCFNSKFIKQHLSQFPTSDLILWILQVLIWHIQLSKCISVLFNWTINLMASALVFRLVVFLTEYSFISYFFGLVRKTFCKWSINVMLLLWSTSASHCFRCGVFPNSLGFDSTSVQLKVVCCLLKERLNSHEMVVMGLLDCVMWVHRGLRPSWKCEWVHLSICFCMAVLLLEELW